MTLPDLNGRIAVITGASRGIGAGLAEDFHARGMRLGLCSRGKPALEEGERVLARQIDVCDAAGIERFAAEVAARFGPIDLWINNAGVLDPIVPVRELEMDALRNHLEVNLFGVIHGSRAFLEQRAADGVLVNISSGAAWQGYAGWGAYCASKAALDRITECLQLEEAGLRAYAVAPGVVDTAMQERIRGCTEEEFPLVERFREMKTEDSFNTIPFVAEHLLGVAFDPEARPEQVVVRLPAEKA